MRYKGGVRLLAYAALLLSVLVLASCNGSDDTSNGDATVWTTGNLVDLDDAHRAFGIILVRLRDAEDARALGLP